MTVTYFQRSKYIFTNIISVEKDHLRSQWQGGVQGTTVYRFFYNKSDIIDTDNVARILFSFYHKLETK